MLSEEEIIAKLEEYVSIYDQLKCQIQPSEVKAIEGLLDLYKNSISKDKLKEIMYPTPTNPIPLEVQQSNMYRKIIELLEE